MAIVQDRSADAIIEALGGNSSGMCRCPAHDDNNPSLHVSEGANGKVLVKCHAGCSQEAVISTLKRLDLWPANDDRRQEQRRLREQREAAKQQDRDRLKRARMILRGAVEAHSTTELVARYFTGRGISNVPPTAMQLPSQESRKHFDISYPAMVFPIIGPQGMRAAHVTMLSSDGSTKLNIDRPRKTYGHVSGGYIQIGELDPDKPLIIAEGIETAASAAQIAGVPAISAISASNMPTVVLPPQYAGSGSEIIVAADNDEPGRNAAKQLAQRLAELGHGVRIAVPEGPEGCDWNDALKAARGDQTQIAELRHSLLNAKRVKRRTRTHALGMADFMNLQFPPREYLLDPWLTTTGLAMIHAPAGHGKTMLALSIGYAVASGRPLMRWNVERRGRVLYVDGELPGTLLQRRLQKLGPSLSQSDFRVLARSQFELAGAKFPDLGEQAGRDALDAIIEACEIDLIILDSVSTLVRSGTENDAESWRVIQEWSLKHRLRGRSVVYLHHDARSGKPRGTSMREVVLDTMIGLKRHQPRNGEPLPENETAFEIIFTKAREFFGSDAAPMIARVSTASGTVEWRSESVTQATHDQIAALREAGYRQRDIARELGLTQGRVSQILSQGRERQAIAGARARLPH